MKSKKVSHSLLFPAYGNIIALVAIGLGILAAFQSVFSWRIIEKELALYLLDSGFLIGLVFFVISKNQVNVKAGLQGRLKIFMGTMVYGVVIVIINPVMTYIFDGEFQYRMDVVTLMLNMCVFYFILGFTLRTPKEAAKESSGMEPADLHGE